MAFDPLIYDIEDLDLSNTNENDIGEGIEAIGEAVTATSKDGVKRGIVKISEVTSSSSEIDAIAVSSIGGDIGNTIYDVENDKYFFDLTDWTITAAGSGTPITDNSTAFTKFNNNSLRLGNSTNGAQATRTDMFRLLDEPLDLTDHDQVSLWIYIDEEFVSNGSFASDWGEIRIFFSDAGNTNGLGAKFGNLNLSFQVGWNNVTLPRTTDSNNLFDIPIGAGTPDWSNIERVRLQYFAGAGNIGIPCYIDSLIIGSKQANPVPFVLTLDDSTVDTFYMSEIMNEYGIPVSTFVIPSLIDNEGATAYIRKHQLQMQYDKGNHVGIHGTGVNAFALDPTLILTARDWLITNGFTRNNGHLYGTYPNGAYSQATIDLLETNNFLGFRQVSQRARNDTDNVQSTKGKLHLENICNGGVAEKFKVSGNRPANYDGLVERVEESIVYKSAYLPYFHLFTEVETTPGNGREEWIRMAKYLKSKVDDGSIECLTFPQFMQKYYSKFN